MGPLLQIEPEGFLYTHVRLEDCDEIIERTILGGEAVERLLYELNGVRYAKHNEIPFTPSSSACGAGKLRHDGRRGH